jgi:hypothetical protein
MKAPETGEWPSNIWDALVGYDSWGDPEPEPRPVLEAQGRWLHDDDDFSSEHGYVPGVEGRTEFEYGEFERWV